MQGFIGLAQRVAGQFSMADGLVLLWAVAALWGVRKAPKGAFFPEPLNRGHGLALRGVFACVVVFHHLAFPGAGFLFSRFVFTGALAVSVFFGLSGYGLACQARDGGRWLEGFWKRRFRALWWPYFVVTLLSFFHWMRGDYSLAERLESQWGLVPNGWFCPVLVLFYAIFWLSFRCRGQNTGLKVGMSISGVAIMTCACALAGTSEFIFHSNGAFAVGLVLGACGEKACQWIRGHWLCCAGLAFVLAMCRLRPEWAAWPSVPGFDIRFFLQAFCFFAIAVLSMKWQLGNRVLGWLGTISYELYLVHGWVMAEIKHWCPGWRGSGHAWVVVAASLAMAWALHVAIERWKMCRGHGMRSPAGASGQKAHPGAKPGAREETEVEMEREMKGVTGMLSTMAVPETGEATGSGIVRGSGKDDGEETPGFEG